MELVQLPELVKRIIKERAASVSFPVLARAAADLSEAYRAGRPARLQSPAELAAYLVTRMPATYAAAHAVLGEVRRRLGERRVASVLDLGAGTGAASLAARHWFPEAHLTLLERNPAMSGAASEWLPEATFIGGDITRLETLPPHDLVIAAYSFGELNAVLGTRLWQAAQVALVVIEPGTPCGFGVIRALRSGLLESGAHILAPCPGSMPCPMAGDDWCHFAARVERSSLHRKVKGGALGYEDEKYSYLAVAREIATLPEARIIRHPQHRPGLVELVLCTSEGLHQSAVRKRDRGRFREARHAAWGDAIDGI